MAGSEVCALVLTLARWCWRFCVGMHGWFVQVRKGASRYAWLSCCVCYCVTPFACGGQDVDQRLTRDIERLCNDLSALIPSMVKPVVDILWCAPKLGFMVPS